MQALMLAAGMGKRLGKYTENNTKCMVEVAGKKLIDRAIEAIRLADIKKFIIVTGYRGEELKSYLQNRYSGTDLELVFIDNKDYAASNNIYSFYLAKDYLVRDDTILLESDLIFDRNLISDVVSYSYPDVVTVARYKSWMDGTVVECDEAMNITQFVDKADMNHDMAGKYYKTVNVYKFSRDFSEKIYIPFLQAYMRAYGLNSYYETVLKVVSHLSKTTLKAYELGACPWYEIDDIQDLEISDVLFSEGEQKYDLVTSKYGGYWRYSQLLDFCYLVNPYFPTKQFVKKMKNEFEVLLGNYPSGLDTQCMNAERMFGVDQSRLLVGNGAAELINALGKTIRGKVAVGMPTFHEYIRCFSDACELELIDNSKNGYSHDLNAYKQACEYCGAVFIVSPDNPSGDMLSYAEATELLEYAQARGVRVLMDESFVDFADDDRYYTLLDNEILARYPNLIVVKSIGKSYGVAGLRLGILATSDSELLKNIRRNMQIWNINSFAEYFLQTYNLFASDYKKSCDKIKSERKRLFKEFANMDFARPLPSQANFITIELKERNSYRFCVDMLNRYGLIIKDLSKKQFFDGKNYVRVAIRSASENDRLLEAFRNVPK